MLGLPVPTAPRISSRFTPSSFAEGVSRTFDIFGVVSRPAYRFLQRSDADALRHDWDVVGHDLWQVVRAADRQLRDETAIQGRLPLDLPE
jgi:hypothetical protein